MEYLISKERFAVKKMMTTRLCRGHAFEGMDWSGRGRCRARPPDRHAFIVHLCL